jgi:arylsulfatase
VGGPVAAGERRAVEGDVADQVERVEVLADLLGERFTSYSGFDIGKDNGDVVSETYWAKAPFAFTGTIEKVVFDLAPGGVGSLDYRRSREQRLMDAIRN